MVLVVPVAAVKVVAVFGKTGKVADAEIAAAAWPVSVVWGRFTEIIVTSPHKLSNHPR